MNSERLTQYALLMRLHRPIGSLLLLWPALIALWCANKGHPSSFLVMAFVLGVFLMRSAGCVINDVADKNLDGFVQRTQTRPLVTGKVTRQEALVLFAFLIGIAFILVLSLNLETVKLSFIGLFLALIYPFMKRWVHFPQVVLGGAFGWAIPMAYSASNKPLSLDCWLLFLATLLWAIAYDTLYAMVDKKDDIKIGIKSTAILFKSFDKFWIGVCHFLMLGLLAVMGYRLNLGGFYAAGLMIAGCLALYQQWLIRQRNPSQCFEAFLNNQWLGASLFCGVLLDYLFFIS